MASGILDGLGTLTHSSLAETGRASESHASARRYRAQSARALADSLALVSFVAISPLELQAK